MVNYLILIAALFAMPASMDPHRWLLWGFIFSLAYALWLLYQDFQKDDT